MNVVATEEEWYMSKVAVFVAVQIRRQMASGRFIVMRKKTYDFEREGHGVLENLESNNVEVSSAVELSVSCCVLFPGLFLGLNAMNTLLEFSHNTDRKRY